MSKIKNNVKNNSLVQFNSKQAIFISFSAVFVTLYFNPALQDPFNSPKMWALFLFSGWIFGFLLSDLNNLRKQKFFHTALLLILIFVLANFLGLLNSDLKYTGWFGETQRRNGFLSYLCLALVMISSMVYVRIQNLKIFIYMAFITGIVSANYGFIQYFGHDFVRWNNPYNSIITTVGNPNFSAAIMATLATIIAIPIFISDFSFAYRLCSGILVILLFTVIYLSQARQGLISIFLGLGIYLTIWVHGKRKKIGYLLAILGTITGVLSILGMLQIGPLTSYLYKDSVSVRGYYWRSGIAMLKDHLFFGVGIDRFGAYFKEYREFSYPLRYGFTITSSNAHDLPIQLLATGGLVLGISYLALTFYILVRGIRSIIKSQGNNKLLIGGFFSAWLAFQAQTIISIDNLGVSIWGWVLGGVVLGISFITDQEMFNFEKKNIQSSSISLQPIFSMLFLVTAIVLVSPLYQAERNVYIARSLFNPQNAQNNQVFIKYATNSINSKFTEPNYKLQVASYLLVSGYSDQGLDTLNKIVSEDPRNQDALDYLSRYFQEKGNLRKSIDLNLQIAKLDPWNSANYLELGRKYKLLGEYDKMDAVLKKINSFDKESNEAKIANSELVQP